MRSNSGSGKSNNNLNDPTMKEHEEIRRKRGSPPAHGRAETAANAEAEETEPAQAGPAD